MSAKSEEDDLRQILPDAVIKQAISAARKVASDPQRGVFAVTQDEITAMAKVIGLLDPQHRAWLAKSLPHE